MISLNISGECDSGWNERLLNSNLGTIHNTNEYATYAKTLGLQPNFVTFTSENGKIVGQVILFEIDRFAKKKIPSILKKTFGLKKTIYKWTYGPVVFDFEYTKEICNVFNEFLISKNAQISGSQHPLSGDLLSCFTKPFVLKTWATFLIDLTQNPDELWKKLDKHSARKNIERSQKRGVYVKEIDDSNLHQYSKMLIETKKKIGAELSESDTKVMWESMHKIGFSGFIAYENETPIGGIMVSFFNKYVNEWGIARTEKDTNEKLYAQDLLKWKVIEWGLNNKFHYYDLTGFNPNPKNEKEVQIFRYKKKFGGDLIKYNLVGS